MLIYDKGIGDHPFNLKGGGGLWFFGGKTISVSKFDGKTFSVCDMTEKIC